MSVYSSPLDGLAMGKDAKQMYVESAARSLEELAEKLGSDKGLAAAMAKAPRETLEGAGIALEREAMELLIATDPKRFDAICDKLFEVMDPGLLAEMVAPSCDGSMQKVGDRHDIVFKPRNF